MKPRMFLVAAFIAITATTNLLSISPNTIHINIKDEHPMSLIAQQIELATGIPISYEEAPIENRSDLKDETYRVDPAYLKKNPSHKMLLPADVVVKADINILAEGSPKARALAALKQVQELPALANYHTRYEVIDVGFQQLALVPVRSRTPSGSFAAAERPLDHLMSYDSGDASNLYWVLDGIVNAAAKETGVPMGLGNVPNNLVVRLRTVVKAQNVSVRSLIHMALDNAEYAPGNRGPVFTWRLIYFTPTHSYLLHIVTAAKSVPAPFGGTINVPIMPREAAQGGQMSEPIGTKAP